jgi:V8-like Glu-specific endopeptidase
MALITERLAAEEWKEADDFDPITDEKVIGLNNLLNIAWLNRGLQLAAPVARLVTPDGPGTAFLIAPDLLLTNHHVLPSTAVADESVAEFNYQVNWAGTFEPVRRFTLDSTYCRTSADLDYTIVRVRDSPGDLYGYVDLAIRAEPAVNDFVSIVQHPLGGPKQICFTDNKVAAVFDHLVQYSTDTEPGSSGSPVFNQQWEIVGLHHKGGGLAGPDGKKHFTNEGILINSVIRDAASFLGLPDTLYDLAFGELRAVLAHLVDETVPPTDPHAVADDLLRTQPRFAYSVDEWAKLRCKPGDSVPATVAAAGVAIGGALRQWARKEGHESIKVAAPSDPPPSAQLRKLVGRFNGTDAIPNDVYQTLLDALLADLKLVAPIVKTVEANITAPARAFLTGVSVGAKAYDGDVQRRRRRSGR